LAAQTLYLPEILGKYYINPNSIQNVERTKIGFHYLNLKHYRICPALKIVHRWRYISIVLSNLSSSPQRPQYLLGILLLRVIFSTLHKVIFLPYFLILSLLTRSTR